MNIRSQPTGTEAPKHPLLYEGGCGGGHPVKEGAVGALCVGPGACHQHLHPALGIL